MSRRVSLSLSRLRRRPSLLRARRVCVCMTTTLRVGFGFVKFARAGASRCCVVDVFVVVFVSIAITAQRGKPLFRHYLRLCVRH